jgi:hypothetical protein
LEAAWVEKQVSMAFLAMSVGAYHHILLLLKVAAPSE